MLKMVTRVMKRLLEMSGDVSRGRVFDVFSMKPRLQPRLLSSICVMKNERSVT